VVSADYNKDTLTVWSLAADGTLAKLPGSPFALLDSLPLAVAFNDTGSLLAVALHNEMEILNFSPDGVATEDSIVAGSSEVQVAFSTDGDYLAATNGGPINVWSVSSQGAMKSLANMPLHPCTSSCELNVAWGANSDMLAVTSYLENALYVETASSGSPAGDTTPPTLTTTATPMWSGSSSVGLSYHGADNVAVASYDVRYERASATGAFGSFSYPASWQATTATRKTMTGVAGTTYCFEARSRDTSGNVSSWSKPGCTAVTLDDRALKASTGWSSITGSGYFDKTARTTKHKSATLTKAGVQTKRITLVASTCSTCGSVRVYLGSALLKTINLYSSRSKNQVRFTVSTFSAVKSGSVVIKTVNTKRVTIDGLGSSRV